MMQFKTTFAIGTLSLLTLGITACQKSDSTNKIAEDTYSSQKSKASKAQDIKNITIGYQKSSLTLLIARQQKLLEQQFPNATVQWKEFPAGPQMLEALSVGAVDIGFVGNTPPIFAQSAGKNIRYIAYETVPIKSLALLIPENSAIKVINDLKGKKVAVQKGSAGHELLGKILEKAGLQWVDITPVWLPPADARAAFDQHSVDAWVTWDPFLAVAERDAEAKVLIDGSAFPATYQYYIANPDYVNAHPNAVNKFIAATNNANTWMVQHPEQSITYYAEAIGQDASIAKKALDKRPKDITIRTLDSNIIASQQKIADSFYKVQLIPQAIDIQKAVWIGK